MSSRIVKAVADVLSDPENAALSAEEVAEKVIDVYEARTADTHNLIVLGWFTDGEGEPYIAAVGPLSTKAPARARSLGERFAWDYKTKSGTGRYMLIPLIRHPDRAWDEARVAGLREYDQHLGSVTPGIEPSYEPMRFEIPSATRDAITASWTVDPEIFARASAAACTCGLPDHPRYNSLGNPATQGCQRHPEGTDGSGDGSRAAGDPAQG